MASLGCLPVYDDKGVLNIVVECPRGAAVKLKYDNKLEAFTISRELPLGLTYPFDWGFIPSTLAADGDPLDALVIHDTATYPGVVLPCRAIGVVEVIQQGRAGKRIRNDRIIARPLWHDRMGEFERMQQIPARLRREIAQFFLSATFFTSKNPKIRGWRGPHQAAATIRAARVEDLRRD
jgi:inorganic pyrophosphatase